MKFRLLDYTSSPHFSSGIVEQSETRARVKITRARVLVALLSLREKGEYL